MDISNGPGVRVSLFTQGCFHHCKHCFNPETWDLYGGKTFTTRVKEELFSLCEDKHCAGLSVLGGEPLISVNLSQLVSLFKDFRETFPDKTIWLWTGYTFENLTEEQKEVVSLCDVVIDGKFVEELKDTSLYYAGSTNQHMWRHLPDGTWSQEKIPSNKHEG